MNKVNSLKPIEDLDAERVLEIIEREHLQEFRELVEEKQLDGRKLMNLTEGIIKLWRPKINAKKLIDLVENIKNNPDQYVGQKMKNNQNMRFNSEETFQMMKFKKSIIPVSNSGISKKNESKSEIKESEIRKLNTETIEQILYAEPPRSFLYRNKTRKAKTKKSKSKENINSSYVPMDIGSQKLPKSIFKMKLHDYANFDMQKLKMFPLRKRQEDDKFNDRGYYALHRKSVITDSCDVASTSATKKPCSVLNTSIIETETVPPDPLNAYTEEHYYEDLNDTIVNTQSTHEGTETKKELNPLSKSPCMLKINEIFSSFFSTNKFNQALNDADVKSSRNTIEDILKTEEFKLMVDLKTKKEGNKEKVDPETTRQKSSSIDAEYHIYESSSGFYDSIETKLNDRAEKKGRFEVVVVEDYLEPIKLNKDYVDVMVKDKEESLISVIMKMLENSFGFNKECEKADTIETKTKSQFAESAERPLDTLQKWNDNLRANFKPEVKTNMAERPLPVPVENEFYYMDVDRLEAQKLLEGHADGTFILRPSSQPFHAYTISLVFRHQVHNVGVRRRADGRLALGFSKRAEQSFQTIKELIEHHYKEKLLLIVDGVKIGSTPLKRIHG